MANDVKLKAFPHDKVDALAFLYLQNQDLTGKTPEELVSMYDEAWNKISDEFSAIRDREKEERRKTRQNSSSYD